MNSNMVAITKTVYQSKTIADVVDNLGKQYVLPALQRGYVWTPEQIEKLFDSIMRGYPISTFMFWEVNPATFSTYVFHHFLNQNFEKGVSVNTKAKTPKNDVYAVIDGQQRLTSLMIGLTGSYTLKGSKTPKYLCLDLNSGCIEEYENVESVVESDDEERLWKFKFLTDPELKKKTSGTWIKVQEVWNRPNLVVFSHWVMKQSWSDCQQKAALQLWTKIFAEEHIAYYLEVKQNLSVVLDEFLRSNDGGTILTAADLLMSQIAVHWSVAKDKFQELQDDVSNLGYDIDVSTILKAALVCCANSVSYKKIKSKDITAIKNNWDLFSKSYLSIINLLKYFWNIPDKAVTSKNALAILVYYVYKFKLHKSIASTANTTLNKVRFDMQRWLVLVLLKGTFGVSSDTVLEKMRGLINTYASKAAFPYNDIKANYFNKAGVAELIVTSTDIDGYVKTKKKDAFPILSLLCPKINTTDVFDIDHLHSKKKCQAQPKGSDAHEKYDLLPNLTRQEPSVNRSKGDGDLDGWYNTKWINHWSHLGRAGTAADLFLEDASPLPLNIVDFADYYARREQILRDKIDAIFK